MNEVILLIIYTMSILLPSAGTLYGPMHSKQGVEQYKHAVAKAIALGGKVECGGKVWCYYTHG